MIVLNQVYINLYKKLIIIKTRYALCIFKGRHHQSTEKIKWSDHCGTKQKYHFENRIKNRLKS